MASAALLLALTGCGAGMTKTVTAQSVPTATAAFTQSTIGVISATQPQQGDDAAGDEATSSATPTVQVTTTPPATSQASGYPVSFEASFIQSCVVHGSAARCQCTLRHIEASVPYSTVLQSFHDIAIGNPPGWFTAAETACGG